MIIDTINDYWITIAIENDDWKFGWGHAIKKTIDTIPKTDKKYDYINKRWFIKSEYRSQFNQWYRESLESYDVNEFLLQFDNI